MSSTIINTLKILSSRIFLMWSHGILTRVDDEASRQKVDFQLLKNETDKDIEHHQPYGFTSHPLPGADVIAFYQGGNRDHGIVIMVEDKRYRLVSLGQGDTALYDFRGQYVKLTKEGIFASSEKHIEAVAKEDVRVKDGYGQEILMESGGITIKALNINIQKPDGAGGVGDVTIEADNATLNANSVEVNCDDVKLGGSGGPAVARIGDDVNLTTGKIITGSSKVTSQ